MILTATELQNLKKPTNYEGVFKYVAPDGYEFWSNNTNFGNVIWGGEYLDNHYYLKEIENENKSKKDIH